MIVISKYIHGNGSTLLFISKTKLIMGIVVGDIIILIVSLDIFLVPKAALETEYR